MKQALKVWWTLVHEVRTIIQADILDSLEGLQPTTVSISEQRQRETDYSVSRADARPPLGHIGLF